jgi:hypothetical protein
MMGSCSSPIARPGIGDKELKSYENDPSTKILQNFYENPTIQRSLK